MPVESENDAVANGGTELMARALSKHVDPNLLDAVHVTASRMSGADTQGKPHVLWLHDTWDDPMCAHLKDPEERQKFSKLVFVSAWQMQMFQTNLGILPSECEVIRNAVEPIDPKDKPTDVCRLIYHTTPHRGLEILVPVFEEICAKMPDLPVHLDVFSSFQAYGIPQRDAPFEHVFERCRKHPQITYHGYQPNSVVREALRNSHIFAYPCIWPETSCIAAIEAMAAGCEIVAPAFSALPETCAPWAHLFPWTENVYDMGERFGYELLAGIDRCMSSGRQNILRTQAHATNVFYSWELRKLEWEAFLRRTISGK